MILERTLPRQDDQTYFIHFSSFNSIYLIILFEPHITGNFLESFNPSNAEATFSQSTKTQISLKTI